MEVNPNVLQRWWRELRQALAKRFPVTGRAAALV
jgi:transposase-like protein